MKLFKVTGIAIVVATAFAVSASTASAHDYDSDDSAHPFRLLSYPFHALGRGIEYGFTRPVHTYVSQPCNRYIYGHVSHPAVENYGGDYDMYQRSSY
jgi:hypothetical protein